jgi:hypothetical protein
MMNTNSNLPNMAATIQGWFLNITFEIVDRVMVGADWQTQVVKRVKTKGVVRPPKDNLEILPEGTWNWEWLEIHCLPNLNLQNNQFIRYDGKVYKVMARKDYSKYGYIRYTVLEAFRAKELEG